MRSIKRWIFREKKEREGISNSRLNILMMEKNNLAWNVSRIIDLSTCIVSFLESRDIFIIYNFVIYNFYKFIIFKSINL